ncbi:hypothetical protein [Devosia sp.]|uniref:hypothetical protein n=1 Tax=Devosia sp. TaxID=1871048 RepID=UPI003A8F846F
MATTGALRALAENLWVVDGTIQMPPGPLPRRMSLARLTSGDLVVFSAIAVDEGAMVEIAALGPPKFLVVPNAFHRQDAAQWKSRYPEMRVIAPEGARSAVAEIVPVDDTSGEFGDDSIRFVSVPGTKGESALVVHHSSGATLIVNDLIGNVRDARGMMKLVLTLMGFAGARPQVPRAFKSRAVQDTRLVAQQFRDWAAFPGSRRWWFRTVRLSNTRLRRCLSDWRTSLLRAAEPTVPLRTGCATRRCSNTASLRRYRHLTS